MRLILALALTFGINTFAAQTIACDQHKSQAGVESLKGLYPSDAYGKYHAVVEQAKEISEIMPYWTAESAKEYETKKLSPEKSKEILSTFQKIFPEKLKVVAETIEGKNALLTIDSHEISKLDKEKLQELERIAKATDSALKLDDKRVYKSNIKGKISMRLENGIWKVHTENFDSEFESDPADAKSDTESKSQKS